VQSATDAFLSIDDDWAHRAMRLFAQVGIVAGESGAASLGGLLALHDQTDARRAVGLTPDATVLMINTEGATDPENYELQVGETPGAGASEAPRRRQATSTATL
jgi:diaminopropionate ammonia-lyase